MTTTVNLRKMLDRKQHEMCAPLPVASAAGACIIEAYPAGAGISTGTTAGTAASPSNTAIYTAGASAFYQYKAEEDGWVLLPASGIGGTFGAGACGAYHHNGPTGTASAGSATTITTTTTIGVSLAGYKIRLTGGTNAGQEAVIVSNTIGANSVITVASWPGGTPDNTTTYLLLSGRFYFIFPAGTPGMRYWDHATQTWSSALTVTGLTHAGTDGRLMATPAAADVFASGTATSATGTTIVDSGKSWTSSQWINYQVRITGGTGKGQVRTITASTGTTLTVATWTVTPDATSTYAIEGNDDYLYFIGNASTSIFRYSISGNSWSSLTARGGASAAGASFGWIYGATSSVWTNENTILNGRRIYSFRGGAVSTLDYYDIPSNTWTNALAYSRAAETFTTGSSACYDGENYIYIQKDATGRLFRFDVTTSELDGWGTNLFTQGAAVVGDKLFCCSYVDGATTIKYVYKVLNTSTALFRCMVI